VPSTDLKAKKFKPTSFEDQVRYAYSSPTPHHYSPVKIDRGSGKKLGKISNAQMPSPLDYGQREKSHVPGPGSYDTPDLRDIPLPEGGRLSRKPPQEKLRLEEYPVPAPGQYGVPHDPTVPRQLYGNFGKDPRITKFIDDEVRRSKGQPSPGEHDVLESMEAMKPFCPEGGRYLEQIGRGPSYFDQAAKLADSKPGPDRYNLPGSVKANKTRGKLVWRYTSETMESTKKVLTKALGHGQDTPAPGQYNVPDPEKLHGPLSQSPTLRGRTLAHSMPHPYAYNCTPDLSGKFDALSMSPIRDKNSGAQIYGRDFSKGAMTKADRIAKAKASADEVSGSNIPRTLAERDIEQPGETVQWRSGGFSSLYKARSAPVIVTPEHPSMQEMAPRYPALAKRHGRKDRTFVPMMSKRPEIVTTHPKSVDIKNFEERKWEMGRLGDAIKAASSAAMEALDEDTLLGEAHKGLMDKAKFQMRMEGLGKEQADMVIAELPGVLMEHKKPSPYDGPYDEDEVYGEEGAEVYGDPEQEGEASAPSAPGAPERTESTMVEAEAPTLEGGETSAPDRDRA